MTLRQKLRQKLRHRDDSGAALVIALVFVTVIAVAIASVLAYADANVRATTALRRQASTAAAADAAAEVAINRLRNNTYDGSPDSSPSFCFGSSNTWNLNRFHPARNGKTDSARVTCEKDITTSLTATTGTPEGYALLALQRDASVEDAIYMKANGSGTAINVAGDVGSASRINMEHGDLNVAGSLSARICSGTINVRDTRTCGPSAPVLGDPDYDPPAAPTGAGTISSCNGPRKRTFSPGVYSNLSALNNVYSSCTSATVFDFRPGVYYFAFNGTWEITRGTTVAGSGRELDNTPPSIPGACTSPVGNSNPVDGVTFVFGGQARLLVRDTARVEVCGRPPVTDGDPAIALYGLKNSRGSVPAQSGCITNTGPGSKCAVITTDNHSDNIRLYIQGHVYMPRAKLDLQVRGLTHQYFNGGATVRAISLFSPASSTIPTPLSSGPVIRPQNGRTVLLLTIYVCAEAVTCGTGGKVRLRVKVGLADPPSGAEAGKRGITIYSWSMQR